MDANLKLIEISHGTVAARTSPGTGMPVVLLHGNSNSSLIFRNQVEGPLGAEYRMIALDLLGHGRSSNALDPERTYNMPGQASAMVEALGRMGVRRAAVFGWSLGGHIGLEMIARFPGMLGLMITGTSPVSGDQNSAGLHRDADTGTQRQGDAERRGGRDLCARNLRRKPRTLHPRVRFVAQTGNRASSGGRSSQPASAASKATSSRQLRSR